MSDDGWKGGQDSQAHVDHLKAQNMTHDNVTDIVAEAQTKWAEIVSNPANWLHLGRKKIDWFNDYGGSLLDEAATLRKQLENARLALIGFVYETTSLSPMEVNGDHWCKISAATLEMGREALKGEK